MIRLCETCGKPIKYGYMTDGCGDFYTHEGKCFAKYMDKTYGKYKWMETGNGEEDEYDGYYVVAAAVVGGIQGTGIFYTECEEEE